MKADPGLLAVLDVGLLAASFGLATFPESLPTAALLVLCAIWIESQAVELEPGGVFSGAAGFYLGAAMLPQAGLGVAAFLIVVAAAVRYGKLGLAAALEVPAAPLSGCLAATLLARALPEPAWGGWAGMVLGVGAMVLIEDYAARRQVRELSSQDRLQRLRLERVLSPLRLAAALLAPAVAWLGSVLSGLPILSLVPAALATHRAAENALFRLQFREAKQAREVLRSSQAALLQARDEARETELALQETQLEKEFLERLTRHLAECSDLGETMDQLVATVSRATRFRSAVVFLVETNSGELVPARFISPAAEKLRAATLLKLEEPLVRRAWEAGRPLLSEPQHRAAPRLLEPEDAAIALPLGALGVLYVGRQGGSFTREETQLLAFVAEKAALALQSAQARQIQKEALALQSRARYALEARVTLLGRLVSGLGRLGLELSPQWIGQALESLLQQVVPHDFGALNLGSDPERWPGRTWQPGGAGLERLDAIRSVSRAVLQGGRPLMLLEGVAGFEPPVDGARSLLCVPLVSERGTSGVLLLAAHAADAFSREHLDVVTIVAYQTSVLLENADLLREVLQTRARLEDSHQQLVQSSKLSAIGQLAAGVAHELNTPLAAIALAVESAGVLLDGNPESARGLLAEAEQAADRARSIVERLLHYSRKSGGEPVRFQLNTAVTEAVSWLEGPLRDRGCALELELDPELEPIAGQPSEIQQIVVNLLLNAADASPRGIPIRLATRQAPPWAVVEVRDRGSGVRGEHRDHLFDPFFTTKEVGRGTGLGLSLSQQIAHRHGGRLELTWTEVGQGSLFTLSLPLQERFTQ